MAKFNSIQECAQIASDIQNACNITGILHTFIDVCVSMRELGISGDALNTHPIIIVFIDKLNSLARIQDLGNANIYRAHDEVIKLCEK